MLSKFKKVTTEIGLAQFYVAESVSAFIKEQHILKALNDNTLCLVRLYILEGFNFAQRDLFSLSDPYMVIKCGKTVFNERQNYQLDTSEPKIYKCFEF